MQPSLFEAVDHEYIPNFLTPAETEALFQDCAKMPFRYGDTSWGHQRKHATVMYSRGAEKGSYGGPTFFLEHAPPAIKILRAKLTAHAGIDINYLAVVRYVDGTEHMDYHQHKEDLRPPGRDMRVWIVSTGAVRSFGICKGKTVAGRFNREGPEETRILAAPGSLIVLPSEHNNTHGHSVLLERKGWSGGVRYAVNAKHLPCRGLPCAACRGLRP